MAITSGVTSVPGSSAATWVPASAAEGACQYAATERVMLRSARLSSHSLYKMTTQLAMDMASSSKATALPTVSA